MEQICKLFLGEFVSPKQKIDLMGDLLHSSINNEDAESTDELRQSIIDRFNRLGLQKRIVSVQHLDDEITCDCHERIVDFLYRLSLSIDDGTILKPLHTSPNHTFKNGSRSQQLRLNGMNQGKLKRFDTSDDGCVSTDDSSLPQTRLPSTTSTTDYKDAMKSQFRAIPRLKEVIECDMEEISGNIASTLSGISSYLFKMEESTVSIIPSLFITGLSIEATRVYLSPILNLINDILLIESSLREYISISEYDLLSRLCMILVEDLNQLREEALYVLSSRPFPSSQSITRNINDIIHSAYLFYTLSHKIIRLRGANAAECLDILLSLLSIDCILENELTKRIERILRFALKNVIIDIENFMLKGEVSRLGVILESGKGSMLDQQWNGGREEGDRWRKNYGIRVSQGECIDRSTAEAILAEGKHVLMRIRDPNLKGDYERVEWNDNEREKELNDKMKEIGKGTTARDIQFILLESIDRIRSIGDRSSFLSHQISLIANSLDIVWQVFLLGDRVSGVTIFDSTVYENYKSIRNAMKVFTDDHLLKVGYFKNVRTLPYITLKVNGALSVIVSSSNISIYSAAHRLLTKLSSTYHKLTEAHISLPPMSVRSSQKQRDMNLALAEIIDWIGKLCSHFCTETHQVVWKQINKDKIISLRSFDNIYNAHRKAIKDLAYRLLINSESALLSSALHSSVDQSYNFANSILLEDWEKAYENYTDFVDSAQRFTQGLEVEDDSLGLRSQLLSLIDPLKLFRM